jgi:hypothetical protein
MEAKIFLIADGKPLQQLLIFLKIWFEFKIQLKNFFFDLPSGCVPQSIMIYDLSGKMIRKF